jgi:hypothetical protein
VYVPLQALAGHHVRCDTVGLLAHAAGALKLQHLLTRIQRQRVLLRLLVVCRAGAAA